MKAQEISLRTLMKLEAEARSKQLKHLDKAKEYKDLANYYLKQIKELDRSQQSSSQN